MHGYLGFNARYAETASALTVEAKYRLISLQPPMTILLGVLKGGARVHEGKIEQSQAPRFKRGGMSGATLGLVLARDFTYQISIDFWRARW